MSGPSDGETHRDGSQDDASRRSSYWRANLRIMSALLAIWFAGSYLCGIVLVERLNAWRFAGFPLGFWIAQQGSILLFVVLILLYAVLMDRLDRRHGVG